jgi:hypothetical protein
MAIYNRERITARNPPREYVYTTAKTQRNRITTARNRARNRLSFKNRSSARGISMAIICA